MINPVEIVLETVSVRLNPDVQARLTAHRLGLPWEKLPLLTDELRAYCDTFAMAIPGFEEQMGTVFDRSQRAFERCGSPIEELFLAALVSLGRRERFTWDVFDPSRVGAWEGTGEAGLDLFQQVAIGNYRSDFVLSNSSVSVAIELDGHEFHERTKAQAQRDKSRDRFFVESGRQVIRFTGSEVWKNPTACAAQALRIARPG